MLCLVLSRLTSSASGEFELHVKDVNILFADELYGIIKFNIADLVDVCSLPLTFIPFHHHSLTFIPFHHHSLTFIPFLVVFWMMCQSVC
jgi:hypothetical protein